MKKYPYLLFLLFFLSTHFLRAQVFSTIEKDNVTLDYPSNWVFRGKENPNNVVKESIFLEIAKDGDKDETRSVRVIRLNMSGKNVSLRDMQLYFEKIYQNTKGASQILKRNTGKVNGYKYNTVTIMSSLEDFNLIAVQRIFQKDETYYFISVASPLAVFADFKTTGIQILDSFEVK